MNLSLNFTLAEMVRSQAALRAGLANNPNPKAIQELTRLCTTVLEPIRELLGKRIVVRSGFRTPQVNVLVGSTAKNSAHLDGRAADIIPQGVEPRIAFDIIRGAPGLPLDQIILERDEWIHVSIPPLGRIPRHDELVAFGNPGAWAYRRI